MLSGAKPIPFPALMKLSKALDIDPETLASLKAAHSYQTESASTAPKRGRAKIDSPSCEWSLADRATFDVLREWYYLPILEFTTLASFDGALESVARRLGLSCETVRHAMDALVRSGLLEADPTRGWRKSEALVRWSSGTSNPSIRRFHEQMLERARLELRRPVSEERFAQRLITGITVSARREKIEEAKRKLSDCLHEIAKDLAHDQGTEVYHLAAQLFPLTDAAD
jgi:uncharacterized protein (TIGR02147 family)